MTLILIETSRRRLLDNMVEPTMAERFSTVDVNSSLNFLFKTLESTKILSSAEPAAFKRLIEPSQSFPSSNKEFQDNIPLRVSQHVDRVSVI